MMKILDTGLVRGDASKIARRHRVSVLTVLEHARGRRPEGRPAIKRSIAAYRERNQRLLAAELAARQDGQQRAEA